MAEEPVFMVHSHNWQDDAWDYEDDLARLDARDIAANARLCAAAEDDDSAYLAPHRSHDLAWWMALLLIVAGALLMVSATAFLCDIIGL